MFHSSTAEQFVQMSVQKFNSSGFSTIGNTRRCSKMRKKHAAVAAAAFKINILLKMHHKCKIPQCYVPEKKLITCPSQNIINQITNIETFFNEENQVRCNGVAICRKFSEVSLSLFHTDSTA